MDIPDILIQQIRDGKVSLLLGAGASLGAQNPNGSKKAISGKELKFLLCDKFLSGNCKSESLATVADYCISETSLNDVQNFIYDLFIDLEPAEFHYLIPTFKWYGIATLNYDCVIEKSYEKNGTIQKLRPAYSNNDKFDEIIRNPNDLLFLKLHGCITKSGDPRIPLILTHDQYITHKVNRSRLFNAFTEWAIEKAVIFVGSSLEDTDIRAMILTATQNTNTEYKPRYYLIQPKSDHIQKRFWSSKKIEVIDSSFEDFLRELDAKISSVSRAIPTIQTHLPIQRFFTDETTKLSESAIESLNFNFEHVHSEIKFEPLQPVDFFRGFNAEWSAISQNLDIKRDLQDKILLDNIIGNEEVNGVKLYAIKGPGGSGKSILLRRLAWESSCTYNYCCFYANNISSISNASFIEIFSKIAIRSYIFIDNCPNHSFDIARLFNISQKYNFKTTFIVTARSGEWNTECENLQVIASTIYEMQDLSKHEIDLLLNQLHKFNAEGTLKGLSREEQESRFTLSAKRQLLVALHETTLGKPFEDIVADEYNSISPPEAQSLYLTICTLNRTGIPVRAGLISRTNGIPFELFQKHFLHPLEHVIFTQHDRKTGDLQYRTRHPHVAELVFRQISNSANERFHKVLNIILCLNVSYHTDQLALQDILNHNRLRDTIIKEELIEKIYEDAEKHIIDDGHIYLQHAHFELSKKSINQKLVRNLLHKAEELLPNHPFIIHTLAETDLSLARETDNNLLREKHLQDAEKTLTLLFSKKSSDPYSIHTQFKINLLRLKTLLANPDSTSQAITSTINKCETILTDYYQKFPNDSTMYAADAEFARTINDEKRVIEDLVQASSKSLKNTYVVNSLARIYTQNNEHKKAIELLTNALKEMPFEKIYHYKYAKILIDTNGENLLIEKHLRSSFTDGDTNLDAHFLYARQLFINGKIDDSKNYFLKLSDHKLTPKLLNNPVQNWLENGEHKQFRGSVARAESDYILITRDVFSDTIIAPFRENSHYDFSVFKHGDRIMFNISFNYRGPVAVNIYKN